MTVFLSVVVRDLDIVSTVVGPDEADPVLVVDPDRVLPGMIADQLLQAVPGGTRRVFSSEAALRRRSFFCAAGCGFGPKAGTCSRFQTLSASLFLKDRITGQWHRVTILSASASSFRPCERRVDCSLGAV
jgi:hypothetical protein